MDEDSEVRAARSNFIELFDGKAHQLSLYSSISTALN